MNLAKGSREVLTDFLIAASLNLLLLGLAALLLWPLGQPVLAWHLAKGYAVLWIVLCLATLVLIAVQRVFRVESDPPSDSYVLMHLVFGLVLQVGWSAFAALAINGFTTGKALWGAILLYVVGLLASHVGFVVISAFFKGSLYKMVNGIAAPVCFIAFAIWPGVAEALFGWFFRFF